MACIEIGPFSLVFFTALDSESQSKWSCFKTDTLSPGPKVTDPVGDSTSPQSIFSIVDFPEPFADYPIAVAGGENLIYILK